MDINERLNDIGVFEPEPDDNLIICRCEEITKGEIRQAVHDGFYQIVEVRRLLRAGMGLCQGLTCGRIVKSIIAGELNISVEELEEVTARAPMRPMEMSILSQNMRGDE